MKNWRKFLGKYQCWSLFLKKFQALRHATLLKSDPSKGVFTWICEVFENTYLRTDDSESVRYEVYILLSESLLEEEKEYKTEDNPWVFRRVICTCEQRYCKINYKYEMHTKTKSCYKNISCWLICSFIFFIFSSKNWFDISHPTYLMN